MYLSVLQIAALVFGWALYALIHSLLASTCVKRRIGDRWPGALRGYRLAFNLLSLLLLLPLLAALVAWRGPMLWVWPGPWAWVADGLALTALAGFFWSLRYYDTGVFSGFAQWRERPTGIDDGERFTLSPLHRYVRHPWYALALVMLWTRDMDEVRLVSALCISLYLWLGSLLEERKLLVQHGDVYARYRRRVNGLIPWPGRVLDAPEADRLVNTTQSASHLNGARRR
ncbi:methyltransferase family protein [Rhodocyclaceae bacterium SMB388]